MGKLDDIESDKRIIDQKSKKHQLTQQDYQKLLKNLPDEKDFSEELLVYREGEADGPHST